MTRARITKNSVWKHSRFVVLYCESSACRHFWWRTPAIRWIDFIRSGSHLTLYEKYCILFLFFAHSTDNGVCVFCGCESVHLEIKNSPFSFIYSNFERNKVKWVSCHRYEFSKCRFRKFKAIFGSDLEFIETSRIPFESGAKCWSISSKFPFI